MFSNTSYNILEVNDFQILEKYGTPEQKDKWLTPLLNAEIRSCFVMTEPGVDLKSYQFVQLKLT